MVMKALSTSIAEIEHAKTDKEKAELMQKNSSAQLKALVGYSVDPGVLWLLPASNPPYRSLPPSADQEGRLYTETRRLIYFVNSPEGRALTQIKREQLFIQLLESIDARDAEMLLRVKNKALKISINAVKMAFPNMSKDWQDK